MHYIYDYVIRFIQNRPRTRGIDFAQVIKQFMMVANLRHQLISLIVHLHQVKDLHDSRNSFINASLSSHKF